MIPAFGKPGNRRKYRLQSSAAEHISAGSKFCNLPAFQIKRIHEILFWPARPAIDRHH